MTALAKVLLVDDEREFVTILTQRVREEQIAKILDSEAKSSGV